MTAKPSFSDRLQFAHLTTAERAAVCANLAAQWADLADTYRARRATGRMIRLAQNKAAMYVQLAQEATE